MTYGWGKYDFAFILTSLLSIICLIKKGLTIDVYPKYILIYIVYWFFIHIVTAGSSSELFSLGIIRVFLCYLMYFGFKDKCFFYKTYRIICFIAIAFFFLQVIFFFLFGYRISGISTLLPLSLEMDSTDYFTRVIYGERSSSFFSEPAAFVEYIFPLLCIELFERRKVNRVTAIIIIIALLLTESGTAVVGLATIAIMYVVKVVLNSKQIIGKVTLLLFSCLVIGFTVYEYSNSEIGQRLLDRQDQLDVSGSSSGQSGFVRVYRGFYIFSNFSAIEQLFGNDSPSRIKSQISASHLEVSDGMSDELYFNTFQTFLIRTGYVGALLFFFILISLARQSDYCGKSIIVLLFTLSLISSMHFTEVMAIYFLFVLFQGNVNRLEGPQAINT